jgi:hypothetical protein
MLRVITLSVIMLSVVAPVEDKDVAKITKKKREYANREHKNIAKICGFQNCTYWFHTFQMLVELWPFKKTFWFLY